MSQYLLLTIRLHGDGQGTARYHGTSQGAPEWPPSPARVFQAVVSGCARGNAIPDRLVQALEWWEGLPPPIIAAPRARGGARVTMFVPNNDADSTDDLRDVSGIRTKKLVHPSLFEEWLPLLYAWPLSGDATSASAIIEAADNLYQLGRGVDMAWAVGALIDDAALETRLAAHPGPIHTPEPAASGKALACPVRGSLASLVRRHMATKVRVEGAGRAASVLFANAPKPHFVNVTYEHAQRRVIYELRDPHDDKKTKAWPLRLVAHLVEEVRDGAAKRLRQGLPDTHSEIEQSLVGRKVEGSGESPVKLRTRIVPLPSIGHPKADRQIRRLLLEVPSGALLSAADVEWAVSALEVVGTKAGSGAPVTLIRTDSDDMWRHYSGPARRWRSVTPAVLPATAARRRIEPTRQRQEAKGGNERMAEEDRAVAAVHVALREAGFRGTAIGVRVQREPFDDRGVRAEPFAEGTRFAKERLWHVEVELDRLVEGPMVIGDGRFLGLGVMAPTVEPWARSGDTDSAPIHPAVPVEIRGMRAGFFALTVGNAAAGDPIARARALRRAVMARVQEELGKEPLGTFFSGHEPNGDRTRADHSTHLAFQWDAQRGRLLVIAPHWLDRREATREEQRAIRVLDRALDKLVELRVSRMGRFVLGRASVAPDDALLVSASSWTSVTPYTVTRHRKRAFPAEVLVADAVEECVRRGFPRPEVAIADERGVAGRGLEGRVRLNFDVAVRGPVVLGRTRYLGGGLFEAVTAARSTGR